MTYSCVNSHLQLEKGSSLAELKASMYVISHNFKTVCAL